MIDLETGNFQNEATPLYIDLKQALFIRWSIACDFVAKRDYYKSKKADVYKEEVRKEVFRLFLFVRASLKKDSEESFNFITEAFKSGDIEKITASFYILDEYLYKKGVTKYDTKEYYDRTRVEVANKHKGF